MIGRFSHEDLLAIIKNNVIVSCQATEKEPFFGSENMVRFAKSALEGGAVAIRANTVADVKAVMESFEVPVLALIKQDYANSPCYITPTMNEVDELVRIGADVVAVDATSRVHPDGENGAEFLEKIRQKYSDLIIMADISTFDEGIAAEAAGANLISTTLSGYTEHSKSSEYPDFSLVESLAKLLTVPLIAEGRIWTPEDLQKMFRLGAYSAVIGSAVTRPHLITKRFIDAVKEI